MKVVFIHPSHPNQFTDIAHALAEEAGWNCSFLVDEKFTESVRSCDPPIPYYGFREGDEAFSGSYYTRSIEEGVRRGKAIVEALLHLRETDGVDLVVGHASFGTTFFIRDILKVPVVSYVELPGYFPVYARNEFPARHEHMLMDVSLRALINSSVLGSDLCIVPSAYAKNLFPADLVHKIRVQMEGFLLPHPCEDRKTLRVQLGLPPDAPIVGFAGRSLESVRGFDIFAKAALEIRHTRPDARFLAIGSESTLYGNESMYLGNLSFKRYVLDALGLGEDDFIFKDFMPRDDFIGYVQAMDVIMFPIFEGAANWGLFEAMACGIPVLASNRCFVPEIIHDGKEGILLEPDDVRGFANAALTILSEPDVRARLGRNARCKIAADYSIDRARDGYAAILQEAVLGNR
ncbi:MAG TPA: glycosyltransferase [Geobacteraceae bacterium]|nr:glycosyltransferase [Geobacteraceae bacterium]